MSDGDFVTEVVGDDVVVRFPDADGDADQVTLWCDLDLGDTDFSRVDGGWELRLKDLPVDCLEYMIDVDGETRLDATNAHTVDGAFGEHSWLPLPGYSLPEWVGEPGVESHQELWVTGTPVGAVEVVVWEPADAADEPLPLLCCHDGPEMAAYAGLLEYVAALVAMERLPRMRVALLTPGPRNERYAANPAYTAALTDRVVPELLASWPSKGRPVMAGQSLGGLAALHAAWTSPGTFAGLLLQSGSFFTPETDPQESEFEYWDEVTGFVASLLAATSAAPGAPVVAMTCGTAEENHANNLLVRDHLLATGVEVTWGETRQGHTWTCWRDLLDPHLTGLLRRVWA